MIPLVPHRRSRRLPFVLPLLASVAVVVPRTVGAIAITPEQARIANFGQVNENYFRGAQPDQASFERLRSLGIKTVIDLQEKGKPGEPGWVRSAGMQYFCVPLSGNRPATQAQTVHFLELVNDPANWPVFVHCAKGRHRTGEMTGIYRIAHDTWTADKAYEEMRKYGYYSFPFHGSLKDYVYEYYASYRVSSIQKATATASATSADSLAAPSPSAATPVPATP